MGTCFLFVCVPLALFLLAWETSQPINVAVFALCRVLFARFAKAEAGCMLSAVPTPGFTATSSSDALPPVGCGSVVDPTRASVFDAVLCMRTATHALGNAPRDDNVRGLVIIVTAAGEQTRQAWCRVRERAPP